MRKIIVLLFLSIFLTHSAAAEESTGLKIAGNLLLLADWNQTRQIARHPETWYEKNPILGRHPSTRRVDLYFAGSILMLNGLDLLLPERSSNALWVGVVVLQSGVVGNNLGIGLRIRL